MKRIKCGDVMYCERTNELLVVAYTFNYANSKFICYYSEFGDFLAYGLSYKTVKEHYVHVGNIYE